MIRLLLTLTVSVAIASAHYPFLHFKSRSIPQKGIPEKFDLAVLPGKTAAFFISDLSQVQYAPGDGPASLAAQVRAAARVWSQVDTSELKLSYGGVAGQQAQGSAPSIDVLFEELPPGVLARGGATVRADANGLFVPILKSVVEISRDLSSRPSMSEAFFGTLVHEFGHALGLQHTLTSSAMSTGVTRTVSWAKPLAADDVAGISALYPTSAFIAGTGSIAGRVMAGGTGVSLASVVAIPSAGAAISTLTNPDGTYQLDGLPPRQYTVYVHPLPPPIASQQRPGDIVYPLDAEGNDILPSGAFEAIWFPATKDPALALPLTVAAGAVFQNVNFSVVSRNGIPIHSVETFAYPASVAVKSPYLSPLAARQYIVARGTGLVTNSSPAPGVSANIVGGLPTPIVTYTAAPATSVRLNIDTRAALTANGEGPRHLVFTAASDFYVLPSAFHVTEKLPPVIATIAPGLDGATRTAVLTGQNLSATTRVLFDGVQAGFRGYDEAAGRLSVVPPQAAGGHRANVVALNADGQSSLFPTGQPTLFVYPEAPASNAVPFLVTGSQLQAGTESLVQIDAFGSNFVDGQVWVSFGSSDVVATRIWVVSPTRIMANVGVSAGAQGVISTISISSGFHTYTQAAALAVQPATPRTLWLSNATQLAPGLPGFVQLNSLLPLAGAVSVTLNERPVPVAAHNGSLIGFHVPAGFAAGFAELRVELNGERSLPLGVTVAAPAATTTDSGAPGGLQIAQANHINNTPIDIARPARLGDMVMLVVTGLADAGANVDVGRVALSLAGSPVSAAQVLPSGGNHLVVFIVPSNAAAGPLPLTISIDGRTSPAYEFAVRN